MVAGLAVGAGLPASTTVLATVAVLLGQVSIGWSNDWIDGRRGRDAGRRDKPLGAGGAQAQLAVRSAALVALGGTTVLSLALGVVPGLLHLGGVALGWAYNLGLKATPWSIACYLGAFGVLPAVVTTAAGLGAPRPWAVLAAACFGAGVHLANALPDLERDREQGIGGLPQRLGAEGSLVGAVVLLAVGAVAALLGPVADGQAGLDVGTASGLGVVGGLLVLVVALGRAGRRRHAFRVTMACGLLVVGLLVLQGGRIAG